MVEPSGYSMLVLDTDTIGKLVQVILERRCGDRVRMVHSGGAALQCCAEDPPDVIWAYWFYGDMHADVFSRRLRATPGIEQIPLLVWSANSALGWLTSLYKAGVTGHLLEPFHPDAFFKARDAMLAGERYGFERLPPPPEE